MIKPTWVIFDVGGVLFDFMDGFRAIQEHLGVDGDYVKSVIDDHVGGEERGSVTLESVFTAILQPIDKVAELDHIVSLWYDRKYWHEDIFTLMKELKVAGYKVAIMTNNWGNMGERLRNVKGIAVAEKIYESSVIGMRKPDLEFYEYVHNDLQTDPAKLFLIDDLKENCDGAILAGWQAFTYDIGKDRGVTANNQLRQLLL